MLNNLNFYIRTANMNDIGFGYKSTMKKIATENHCHCAYGGEELNEEHRATAEHVKLHSKGGTDNDSNFLPVCEKHNQERANTPLPEYLDEHPDTIKHIKKTILELSQIKTPDFDGHTWAKKIIKAIENEARTKLNLDLGDDVSETTDEKSEYDLDKTLVTSSGKKIHVKRKKSLDFVA